ncbi:hypothetical protein F5141DRAFT_121157 [Pisolithus sp. B1]|nr:hypothetical protein F5141DRAFT_121157 [Pisolithus sp. B1]
MNCGRSSSTLLMMPWAISGRIRLMLCYSTCFTGHTCTGTLLPPTFPHASIVCETSHLQPHQLVPYTPFPSQMVVATLLRSISLDPCPKTRGST